MASPKVTGKSLAGVDPSFLANFIRAVIAVGGTAVYVVSGKRNDSTNSAAGGVPDSKHLTGNALDAKIRINGQWVPAGTALKQIGPAFGIRSGDQPGFFNGQPDVNHVDNALVNNNGTPAGTTGNGKTPPSGKLSFSQIESLWIQAGGSAALAPTMAGIAMAESGGNPTQHNTNGQSFDPSVKTGDDSYGLWQINYNGYLRESRRARFGPEQGMYNPLTNARAAVAIAQGGKGLNNWTTYKNHAYLRAIQGSPNLVTGTLDPFGIGGDIKSAITDPFGIKGLGKDIMYISVILGGGSLIVLGLLMIGLDLGISGFKAVEKAPPLRVARAVSGKRNARRSASASAARQATTETRRAELHEAKVKTEKARATDLRSRSRARTTAARQTKEQRQKTENAAYIRGAADAASPTLTSIRKNRKAS